MTLCPCGKPLHYTDNGIQKWVEEMIAEHGPTTNVTVEGRTWKVPRHYIALHGLMAFDLPNLAKTHDWEEVTQ